MKFICDVMLGKLGRWLRMCGFDTLIANTDQADRELISITVSQDRTLLTRDKTIGQNTKAYYIKSDKLEEQLADAIQHFKLKIRFPLETRCPMCNGILISSSPVEGIKSDEFWKCSECEKDYWKGSHWQRIMKVLEQIKKSE